MNAGRTSIASWLAENGAPVFPLHGILRADDGSLACTCGNPNCRHPGKHPMARFAPSGFKDATTDTRAVRQWFEAVPGANIGMATGKVTIIDVDPRHGGDATLAALEAEHGPLPHTVRARTGGGGQHIFFRPPAGVTVGCYGDPNSPLGHGLDVRGAGGYIVAVGSDHISGGRYEWSAEHHPLRGAPVAPLPEWMAARLAKPERKAARPVSEWRELVTEGVTEGGRNTAVAKLAGYLICRHVDFEVVHQLLQCWNEMRFSPPLEEDEVTSVVEKIARAQIRKMEARYVGL
ncbi:Bifunctional DNA primase/polymerase [Methylobacterium sp. 4-46]|uniref:bifunctional DNA primase/polymerase n=1 Tax=unclassified Methylobacterium TaxID=2615210 RepID=UPI000165C891|nr:MULTISPECIES: bifunctional DNA primase/polymerase [Methylobacterium]ACA15693.1 Bifunctional DNA primase/polymerase [Methylobacterium sp. 4-46]WFT83505.1 bifunctional DNA primase/polymerase [Methylobacterium nodulans]